MKDFNLSQWAITNQALVLYALLVLLVAGVFSYRALPQKEDPDFTFKVMSVNLRWPGATAKQMEELATVPLEDALQATPWLDRINSYSQPGEAHVLLSLKDATPPGERDRAWEAVRRKLADLRGRWPEGMEEPVADDEMGDIFGSIYALSADHADYAELERQARRVRTELLKIEQVDKVKLIGTQNEAVYVECSPATLSKLGLAPQRIAAVLKERNALEPAGAIEAGHAIARLRLGGDFAPPNGIADIAVAGQNQLYRLGDICRVQRGPEEPAAFKMKAMGDDAIGLAVSAAPGSDAIELGRRLNDTIDAVRAGLPPDTQIRLLTDQPKVVQKSTHELMQSLFEALAIVLAVSFLSLGGRAGLVVALSIPVVMAGTFLLMKLCGVELQRVSIGALIIAIGLLVDDAMIAVEMMKVKLEQGLSKTAAAVFAYKSTAFPMLTGTLITAAAFMPVGLAQSDAGEYTFSICPVVTIALLVSWLVAVIFTPYLGFKLLHEHPLHVEPLYDNRFYTAFRKLVIACLDYRKTTIAATVAIFALSLAGFTQVQQQFFPPSERPELLVDVWLPEGASAAATEARAEEIAGKLKGDADILHYASYIGGPAPRFYLPLDIQLPAANYAQIVLTTHDMRAREAVLQRIRDLIAKDYRNAGVRVSRLENGPPVGYPVQFRVTGENPDTLREIADRVLRVVKANPHVENVSQDGGVAVTTLAIEVDRDKARALGVSPQSLARQLQALSQDTVGHYRDDGKQIPIVMRADEAARRSPEALARSAILTSKGDSVPLAAFARLKEAEEPGILWRLNRQPVITVRADVSDQVEAPEVSQAIDQALAGLRAGLPAGYAVEAGGALEGSDQSQDSIVAVLPLMGIVILTLLMLQLKRFSLVALVLLTAPLGLIGVTAALLPFHIPFGFVAMLGVISLAGMIMRNSLILVDQIEQDVALGLSRFEAIVDSTVRRARPILLTAAAAILAMVPLTGSVFWGPMAAVIMGGLLVATLLTLLYLPALYAAWFRVSSP